MRSPSKALLLVAAALAGAAVLAEEKPLTVLTRREVLRKGPSFLSGPAAVVERGAALRPAGAEGAWLRVRTEKGEEGWIHRSAVTDRSVQVSRREKVAGTPASDDEVTLASKGFSPEIEKADREKAKDADYAAVDRMEKLEPTPEEVAAFMKAGELTPREGGP